MNTITMERHYSVEEIAERLNLGRDSVRRLFLSEPGVVVLQGPKKKYKRSYRTVRIPESVFQRVYRRLTIQVAA
jgi:transcriptional regulator GlxA family with amidase domain